MARRWTGSRKCAKSKTSVKRLQLCYRLEQAGHSNELQYEIESMSMRERSPTLTRIIANKSVWQIVVLLFNCCCCYLSVLPDRHHAGLDMGRVRSKNKPV